MKLCKKCGTPQNDSNFRCVECGEILPKPLSDKDEEIIEDQISDYIDDRVSRTDPFYVSLFDKIMVAVNIAGVIASVLMILTVSNTSDGDYLCLLAAVCFALGAIDTAFPQIQWFFEKLRVELHYHVEHLEPSDLYLISRKVLIVAIPVLAFLVLLFVLTSGDFSGAAQGVVYENGSGIIVTYGG